MTNSGHFSAVLNSMQRTINLPGGELRGFRSGKVLGGLTGLQSFQNEVSETEKDVRKGHLRSALNRANRLATRFDSSANAWSSTVTALLSEVRYGQHVKHLEKLKALKAAESNMNGLIVTVRKSLQDLIAAIARDLTESDQSQINDDVP